MRKKRDDIQLLRTLAILAVLAFHIWPSIFSHGYLGVDIFFVISGYLMSLIWLRSKVNFMNKVINFYIRRIKRIAPVFLLVIFLTLFIGSFLLIQSDMEKLITESWWSIAFANNIPPMLKEKSYFEILNDYNFLTHTWSLSVEVQYYVLAPFLFQFLACNLFSPIIMTILILFGSLFLQLYIKNEEIAFELLFCRIWQFLIGTAAYYFSLHKIAEKETQTNNIENLWNKKYFQAALFCILFFICFNIFDVKDTNFKILLRVITTFIAGILITLEENYFFNPKKYLFRILLFIGEISYTIYMVHWPVIMFLRYLNIIQYGSPLLFLIITVILLLVYYLFEAPLVNKSIEINATCIISLYFIIIIFSISFPKFSQNQDKIIMENQKLAKSCYKLYFPCKPNDVINRIIPKLNGCRSANCVYNLNPNGTKTALIIGNSHAYTQNKAMILSIKQSKNANDYSKIYFICRSACLTFGNLNKHWDGCECEKLIDVYEKLIEEIKPDLIIINQRLDHLPSASKELPKNLIFDYAFQEINKSIQFYSKHTSKLIYIKPHPEMNLSFTPNNAARLITQNGNANSVNITIEDFETRNKNSWLRVETALKYCHNCLIINSTEYLCQKDYCPLVDEKTKLSMYCDRNHLTEIGAMKFLPAIINAIDN